MQAIEEVEELFLEGGVRVRDGARRTLSGPVRGNADSSVGSWNVKWTLSASPAHLKPTARITATTCGRSSGSSGTKSTAIPSWCVEVPGAATGN